MLDIILYVTAGVMVSLVLLMAYFKDFYQRLICTGLFVNVGAVLIVALGSYQYNQSFVDIAIIYVLLGYVVNMAVVSLKQS